MNIESLTIGLHVNHPQYGIGKVKAITEKTAEIEFSDETKTVDPLLSELTRAEAFCSLSGLELPLQKFLDQTVETVLEKLGYENPQSEVEGLGKKWQGGEMSLQPENDELQPKTIPLEIFFRKVVAVRNQLRVLEQKINSHPKLADSEKVEIQQYITRAHGSLTSFNVLFQDKEDHFGSKA